MDQVQYILKILIIAKVNLKTIFYVEMEKQNHKMKQINGKWLGILQIKKVLKGKSHIKKENILDKLFIMKINGKCMEKENLFGMINPITMEVLGIIKEMDMQ